jgi:hypothetical protein
VAVERVSTLRRVRTNPRRKCESARMPTREPVFRIAALTTTPP